MYRVVVPARYGSTRLPGKPLLTLARQTDDPAGL
jgi:CMP-2-keto-3-deoxyoctulosonic acid synthetase